MMCLAGWTAQMLPFLYLAIGAEGRRVDTITADAGNTENAANLMEMNGYSIYGWDCLWEYIGPSAASDPKETPEEAEALVKNKVLEGNAKKPYKIIVLAHDHMFRDSRGNKVKLDDFVKPLKAWTTFKKLTDY
jgi:hypothetical protein